MIYSVCRILSVMAAWEMRGDCRSKVGMFTLLLAVVVVYGWMKLLLSFFLLKKLEEDG